MLLKLILTNMFLLTILNFLSLMMKLKLYKMREKTSPFECGFDPQHKMRLSFSLRFFLITILFLMFDVEIAVMLPLPLSLSSINNMLAMFCHFSLFLILTLGLLFEWKQGALEWAWTYI